MLKNFDIEELEHTLPFSVFAPPMETFPNNPEELRNSEKQTALVLK